MLTGLREKEWTPQDVAARVVQHRSNNCTCVCVNRTYTRVCTHSLSRLKNCCACVLIVPVADMQFSGFFFFSIFFLFFFNTPSFPPSPPFSGRFEIYEPLKTGGWTCAISIIRMTLSAIIIRQEKKVTFVFYFILTFTPELICDEVKKITFAVE